ncbi:hypothetical protein [Calothrix rhizosoleniae]|uniref:hypothetical protein n=1 Tax=Calothrix rhizosoleniae TaxID=888997 RepID=UPI001F44D9F0|nr:hypothetical protein [Calothrix rhizosoleniae]
MLSPPNPWGKYHYVPLFPSNLDGFSEVRFPSTDDALNNMGDHHPFTWGLRVCVG